MSISKMVKTKEDQPSRMNKLLTNNPTGELIKVIYEKTKQHYKSKRIYR